MTEELINLRRQGAKAHPVMINKAVRAMQPENAVTGLFITAKLFTDVAVRIQGHSALDFFMYVDVIGACALT